MSKITAASLPIELKGALKANSSDFINVNLTNLANYNEELLKQFGYMDNQGLAFDDEEGSDGAIYIDELYVLPNLSENRLSPEALAAEEMESANSGHEVSENQEYLNLTSCLAKNQRLVLLGDPGVGKTTLVQWLVCSLCHPSRNFAKERLGPLFPLLLTARKLPLNFTGQSISNDEFLEAIFNSQTETLSAIINSKNNKPLVADLLGSGQVLFIVDGLDEVSSETAHWLSRQVKQFLSRYPRIRLILTSRIVGFDEDDFWYEGVVREKSQQVGDLGNSLEFDNKQDIADENEEVDALSVKEPSIAYEGNADCLTADKATIDAIRGVDIDKPKVMYMAPFTPSQRNQFSKNWMHQYLPPNEDQRNGFLKGIREVSSHSIQLNALSRIPVLLNLICFILWRRGKLPNGRAELYQRIVETYLVTMDKVRLIKLNLSDEYDYMDIKAWLGKLALHMQAGDLSLLDCDEISKLSEDKLDELRSSFPKISEQRRLQISESKLKKFLQIQLTEVLEIDDVIEHVKHLIDYIKTRTGFLIPRGVVDDEEQYSFSHLSFQEYFSAYALGKHIQSLSGNFNEEIASTVSMESWSEIWQLLFEELSLAGISRTELERFIDSYFLESQILWSESKRYIERGIYTKFILYLKLIVNSSVKLSNKFRLNKQINISKWYFSTHLVIGEPMVSLLSNLMGKHYGRFFESVRYLEKVNFAYKKLDNYDWLADLKNLRFLNLAAADTFDLGFLRMLTKLESLNLDYCGDFDLALLRNFDSLKELKLIRVNVRNIEELAKHKKLEVFSVPNNIGDYLASKKLPTSIRELVIEGVQLPNLESLEPLENLRELTITDCTFNDYSSLTKLTNLYHLCLLNSNVSQLTCLPKNSTLKRVLIHYCEGIVSFEPLIDIDVSFDLDFDGITDALRNGFLRWPELSKSKRKNLVLALHKDIEEYNKRLKSDY